MRIKTNKKNKKERTGSVFANMFWIYYGACALAVTSLGYVSLDKWGLALGLVGSGAIGLATRKGLSLLKSN